MHLKLKTNSKKKRPRVTVRVMFIYSRILKQGNSLKVLDEALQDSCLSTTQFLIYLFTSFCTESIQPEYKYPNRSGVCLRAGEVKN